MADQENSTLRPLPKRVLAIRNDECALPMNLYTQKYITAGDETSLAKDLLIHTMYEPVIIMIRRAVFYAYMEFRSIFSFVIFFGSLYSNITSPIGRTTLKTWFLEAIQQRERLHYNHLPINMKRQESLIAMINGILNDRLVNKADCVTYFTSPTLKALNIIPCKVRFDRRCERLDFAPMNEQDKEALSESYNDNNLANKVIHHYILNTMDMDNTKYGYATLSMAKVDEFDKLFQSYLVGDDKVDTKVIIDIMLDLFMDEVQVNYPFWMEMIRRSKNMVLTRPSITADDKNTCPSSQITATDKESLRDTNKAILTDLFTLKLNDVCNSNTTQPCALHFTLALVIKDGLLDLETLLSGQHQGASWLTPLVMAMFSIGDQTNALWILQNTKVSVSGALCDWLQRMMVARITSWFTEQTTKNSTKLPAATTTPKPKSKSTVLKRIRNRKRRPSPLAQVTVPRDGYYLDSGSEDEIVDPDDYDNQHIDHCAISPARTEESFASETTLINTLPDDNSVYGGDDNNDIPLSFDYFSPKFFYQNSTTSFTALQLLRDLIVPCMISIGGTQMAAAPNTMNNIILLTHQALLHYHRQHDRPYLEQLFTTYIFPVLAYTDLEDLHACLGLLTTDERLNVYLRWRSDRSDDALRAYRDQAMDDVQDVLDSISSASSSASLQKNIAELSSLAQHHPIDVAHLVLDRLEKMTMEDGGGGGISRHNDALVRLVVADLVCDDNQPLLRDGIMALLAHRLNSFKFPEQYQTTENQSSLPPSVASLCQFSRYLFNTRELPSTALFGYLNARTSAKPGFLTARFISYACGRYPDPAPKQPHQLQQQLQQLQQQEQLQTPILTKKRSATVLGTSYLTNKKSCR